MSLSKKEISDRRYADVCGLAKECEDDGIRLLVADEDTYLIRFDSGDVYVQKFGDEWAMSIALISRVIGRTHVVGRRCIAESPYKAAKLFSKEYERALKP